MQNLEKKVDDQVDANHNLWQELYMTRERDQNLEKMYSLMFNCVGLNLLGNSNISGGKGEVFNNQFTDRNESPNRS